MSDRSEKKSQPFSMWQGLNLPNWLKMLAMRPPMDFRHTGRLLSISAGCLSNSLFELMDAAIYARRVSRAEVPAPVFIIGHWRSGTTLLHNLLSEDPRFACPNGYEVTFPGHFLLTQKLIGPMLAPLVPKTRPMDDVPVTPTSPQEDEVALAVTSLISPYLMTAFHTHDHLWHDYLEMRQVPEAVRERWKSVFMWFLQRLTVNYPGKQLLLKSPTHTFRVALLRELFPDAKFVYIVRNPYRVYMSSMHLRRTIFSENGFAVPNQTGWEESVLGMLELSFETVARDRQKLAPNQFHELRLEDLERDILGELKSVYDHLELPGFEHLEAKIKPQLETLQKHKKNEFKLDEAIQKRVYERMRPVFERYDYPSAVAAAGASGTLPPGPVHAPNHLPLAGTARVA